MMRTFLYITTAFELVKCIPGFGPQSQQQDLNSNNASKRDGIMLEQGKIFSKAATLNTAEKVSPDFSRKFISGDVKCNPLGTEGNWQMAQNRLKEDCKARVYEKKEQAKKLVDMLSKPPSKSCVKQLGASSMVCAAKKIMNNVVEDPYYRIMLFGNVIQLVKDGKVKFMGVVENFHYKVKTKLKERITSLKNPTAVLVQSGEIPKPNKNEPCTSCLQALAMKSAEEGQNENCDSCEPYMSITGPKCGTFKDVHEPENDSNNSNTGTGNSGNVGGKDGQKNDDY
jgi:hypothetical protein